VPRRTLAYFKTVIFLKEGRQAVVSGKILAVFANSQLRKPVSPRSWAASSMMYASGIQYAIGLQYAAGVVHAA